MPLLRVYSPSSSTICTGEAFESSSSARARERYTVSELS